MPVETNTASAPVGYMDKNQLGDGADGVDSTAHLTGVGDANATTAAWYVCANNGAATPTAADCASIGSDTTPTTRTPTSNGSTVTNTAFDFSWDIPSTFDEDIVDIAVVFCNGAQPSVGQLTSTSTNCSVNRQRAVYLDDSATVNGSAPGLGQNGQSIPTGEIMGFCVQTGRAGLLPGTHTNDCFATSTGFTADGNGGVTPQTYVLTFRTSSDVTGAAVCIDNGANSAATPSACDQTATAVPVASPSGSGYVEWNATPTAVTAGDYDLGIAVDGTERNGAASPSTRSGGAAGECQGGTAVVLPGDYCIADDHYKVAQAPAGTGTGSGTGATASLTFNAPTSSCSSQDDDEYQRNGSSEVVTGCLVDQFGQPLRFAPIFFASTGVGNITSCTNGTTAGTTTPTGTRPTGCSATTNGDGVATATAQNLATPATNNEGTPGDQIITFCADDDTNGCTDETVKDTVTLHWVGLPDHVHLVVEGTGDAADPCHTGDQFTTLNVGDSETLLACTFNLDDKAAPTVMTGEAASVWTLRWTNGAASTVAFGSNPPSETGTNAQATLDILAVDQGSAVITVEIYNNGTATGDTSSVTVTVSGGGGTQCNDGEDNDGDGDIDFPNDQGCTSINDNTEDSEGPHGGGGTAGTACEDKENDPNVIVGTSGADVLQGTANRDIICGLGGADVISARAGNDLAQGNGGADTVGGGGGKDNITGNGGRDNVSGNKGNDAVKGAGGGDTLKGNGGIDSITGGAGADSLQGGDGEDVLKGGGGDDTLRGGAGDDALNGGSGTDQCFGNAGSDSVTGCE
ncbi:MAG: hypothetical protein QOG04_992 [Actinomycetota bacterium]|nr:hypothetical protein [Actinomycetota bacterium]